MPSRTDVAKLLAESQAGTMAGLRAHVSPAMARLLTLTGFDRRFVRGEGPYLWDEDGTQILDCLAGFGALLLGRGHPRVLDAVRQCVEIDPPAWVRFSPNGLAIAAARLLKESSGRPDDRVYFANSGTEAVEAAIKLARRHTGRSGIVGWDDSFHGFTFGSLSASGNPDLAAGFGDMLPGCRSVPFGDLAAMERELSARSVAAVIVEPVQGKTLRSLAPGRLSELHAMCRAHGTLLIADEVQSGLGRTGSFLACAADGVEPELVVLSKGMSGGYVPVGAVLARADVWESTFSSMERAFVHSSTNHEGPLAMVATVAALESIAEERLVEHAARQGGLLVERLRRELAGCPAVREVRGRGLMIGIEVRVEEIPSVRGLPVFTRYAEPMVGQALVMDLFRRERVLSQVTGARRPVLKLLPPMVIGEPEVAWICSAVPQALARLSGGSVFGAMASGALSLARAALGP